MKIVSNLKLSLLATCTLLCVNLASARQPNVVIMLADDLGYGEVQVLNPDGKIKTPQLDQLAADGLIFTDAHSGSSVCTPTRYGLMTGRYAWRTRLQNAVLKGGESLIAQNELTMAKMLKTKGYETVMIGKWHLGMLFDGKEVIKLGGVKKGAKVSHGPIDFGGFDKFYGFHYARQMDLWIEDEEVTENLKATEMLPKLTQVAVNYIEERKGSKKPFFMYIPWNSPHSPVVPSKEWEGKSGLNKHADFVMQTDDSYGRVIQALKDNGHFDNTLIIATSDNGTSPQTAGMGALKKAGHHPSGIYRGAKSDVWDGGHRVPFIVSWPKYVKAGTTTDALVCLTDVVATTAQIVGYDLKNDDAVDSFSFAKVLTGKSDVVRKNVIHHSINGLFAIREGKWKLCANPGSGGWGNPSDSSMFKKNGADSPLNYQLYDMENDPSEKNNLAAQNPEVVSSLRKKLQAQIDAGRTTPGTPLKNDVPIIVDKWDKESKKGKKKDKKKDKS